MTITPLTKSELKLQEDTLHFSGGESMSSNNNPKYVEIYQHDGGLTGVSCWGGEAEYELSCSDPVNLSSKGGFYENIAKYILTKNIQLSSIDVIDTLAQNLKKDFSNDEDYYGNTREYTIFQISIKTIRNIISGKIETRLKCNCCGL